MGLLQTFKNVSVSVGEAIAPLGKSLGNAFAAPEISKMDEDLLANKIKLSDSIVQRARAESDPVKRKALLQTSQKLWDPSQKSIYDQIDGLHETPLQTLSNAALTGANVIGGLSLVGKAAGTLAILKSKTALDIVAGAGGIEKLSTGAKLARIGTVAAKDFAIGAGFGTLLATSAGKTNFDDIRKSAIEGGIINAILPPAAGAVLKGAGKLIGATSRVARTALEEGVAKMALYAENPIAKTASELEEFINISHGNRYVPIMKKAAGGLAEAGQALLDVPSRLKTAVIDRLNPIRDMSKHVSDVLGRPVSFFEDPYQQARRTQGIIDGKFGLATGAEPIDMVGLEKKLQEGVIDQKQFEEFGVLKQSGEAIKSIANDFGDVSIDADAYLAAKNALDRVNLGQTVVRNKTKAQIEDAISTVESSPNFSRIQEYESQFSKLRTTLNEIRKRGGLIDDAQEILMTKAHPNYVPNKVMDFFDDAGGVKFNEAIRPSGLNMSVSQSGIKKAKGSAREIMNPVEAMVVELKKAITDAERNKTANMLIDLGKQSPTLGFLPLRTADNVREQITIAKQLRSTLDQKFSAIDAATKELKVGKGIARKISNTEKELQSLTEEAQVYASNYEPSSKITALLQKADTREGMIYELEQKATMSKDETDRLAKLIEERKADVSQLRSEMAKVRDVKVKEVDIQKDGFEKVSRYVDGIREDWLVPKDIGVALKHLDTPELGMIGKVLAIPANLLKAGSTRFSLDFILRNPARDVQTAFITSKNGLSGIDWIKILLQSKGKSGESLNAALTESNLLSAEGGLLSGLLQNAKTPKSVMKAIESNKPILTKANETINPLRIIEKVGEHLENTTRRAVFKTNLDAGMTPAQAAFETRNASIDFEKMGTVVGVLNKFIPFLNARVQGFVNVGHAIASDPTQFVRKQMWTAVYPAMLLNAHNNQYASYRNIDQRTKDQHWIIMLGEEDGVDDGGEKIKIPNAIRIPKGESQQAVANTVTNFLDYLAGRDHRSWQDLTGDLATGISPISGMSALGPMTTPLELSTNFDLFSQKKIVPDYIYAGGKSFPSKDLENKYKATAYSSETAKRIGQWFDISPAQIDFVNGKLFGSLGTTILRSLDIAEEGFKPKANVDENRTPLTAFQKFEQLPVFKGFLTSSTYGAHIKDLELANKVTKELANPEFVERQKAEVIFKTLKLLPKEEASAEFQDLKKEDKKMAARIKDIADSEKTGLNSTDRIVQNLQVANGERSLYIVEQLNMIDTKEGKSAMWKRWSKLKFITPQVKKQIDYWKKEGRLEMPKD